MHVKIAWLAVVFWMGLIFFFSHQPGQESAALSSGITQQLHSILTWLPLIDFEIGLLHALVRKGAHFVVYLVLGMLLLHALRTSGILIQKAVFFSWFISTIYAATDEYHQTFIPGRVGDPVDVVIDSAGAVTGIIIYLAIHGLIRWKKRA
ncbi:VanZ family protein [Salisediminibacterium beveridgei]|uniref:VanZ family protein n=1 Tax=Salisediminibacterium beveridgei TaxID=632773 RepID=A0A1D7QRI8_9BACI|nr:VanZ family protein [Salisediminibacterium beveridgei]AOM81618.1 VanZ family protein [Salisediminibacterium beveridgei]